MIPRQFVFPVTYNDKFYKDVLEVGELAKLAYLLHYEAPAQLQADCARCTGEVRRRYEEIFANMGN